MEIRDIAQDENKQHILITVDYKESIVGQIIVLELTPTRVENLKYDYVVPPVYYSEAECQAEQTIQKATLAMTVSSYAIMVGSLLIGKLIGLELFGVAQLAYFALG